MFLQFDPQKIFTDGPIQFTSNIRNTSELHNFGPKVDWHKDPNYTLFREIIRLAVADILILHLPRISKSQIDLLENQLFMEAVSVDEYRNLDTLKNRLQMLINQNNLNYRRQRMPFSTPNFRMAQSSGMQKFSHNTGVPSYPPYNCGPDTGINMATTENCNLPQLPEHGRHFSMSNWHYNSGKPVMNISHGLYPFPNELNAMTNRDSIMSYLNDANMDLPPLMDMESGSSNFDLKPQGPVMVQQASNISHYASNKNSLVLEDIFQYKPVMRASRQYFQHQHQPFMENFGMPYATNLKYDVTNQENSRKRANPNTTNWDGGPLAEILNTSKPPLKRLKLGNSPFSFQFEDGTFPSPVLPPSMDSPSFSQGHAQSPQCPEASMYTRPDTMEENKKPFINVTEAFTSNISIGDSKMDKSQECSPDSCVSKEELDFSRWFDSDEFDIHFAEFMAENKKPFMNVTEAFTSNISISDSKMDKSQECSPESFVSENITDGSKEEFDFSRSVNSDKFDIRIAENAFEDIHVATLGREISDGNNINQTNSQIICESEIIVPCQEIVNELQKVEVEVEVEGVSLTEYFTAEQIKEHISSLKEGEDQVITDKALVDANSQAGHDFCQLCYANKLVFAPPPLYCSPCGARIKHKVAYYDTHDQNGAQLCFCSKCYTVGRNGVIKVNGNDFSKAKLQKKKNEEALEESWVECSKCKRWQHQICTLYNDKKDLEGKAKYICPICCLEELNNGEHFQLQTNSIPGAKDLPTTKLSDHMEQRLFRYLKKERAERANAETKKFDEVPEAADLVIREVLSEVKQLKVKDNFYKVVQGDNYPAEFSYRSRVILVFQKIEGVDVCIFCIFVQEFGSECGASNQRCVYISYLDSVKYFRPEIKSVKGEALRTVVYHEILIGYLDYCKKRGFTNCYIWACPPVKEEDYILNCHPKIQRTPKSDKLRKWYQSMLGKAVNENVVVESTNFYDHFFVSTGEGNNKVTASRLPYFDGDYWTTAAEDFIRNIEQDNEPASKEMLNKVMTKRAFKAMGHNNSSGEAAKDFLLMQQLGQAILPLKEDFIVAHLQFVCSHCREVILSRTIWSCNQCKKFHLCERCNDAEPCFDKRGTHCTKSKEIHSLTQVVNEVPSETDDNDVEIKNRLFESRVTFLSFCQNNYYQFDTLRRAKHSSMMVLYFLKTWKEDSGKG